MDYERLWHLIIPPVMTLLDDYQAIYKLRGVEIVSEMLKKIPGELLKRTGVDGLLLSVGFSYHSLPRRCVYLINSLLFVSLSIRPSRTSRIQKHPGSSAQLSLRYCRSSHSPLRLTPLNASTSFAVCWATASLVVSGSMLLTMSIRYLHPLMLSLWW
jgi:Protein of unknown function (DUF2454).